MSVRTMARVWDQSEHSGTELLMLLAIADFADDEGNAYPAVPTLAAKCRMSPRNANFILSALRDTGELEVRPNEGPRGTNRYKVVTGLKPASPLKSASPLKPTSSTPEAGFPQPLKPTSDEPPLNHQEPPVRAKRARRSVDGQLFEDWYAKAKAENPKLFADTDPVHAYIKKIGLTNDFMEVAWFSFKARHMASDKKQKNWPQTFLTYLRNGWIRVWFRSEDGVWRLNTAGKQLAIENNLDPEMTSGHSINDWTVGII